MKVELNPNLWWEANLNIYHQDIRSCSRYWEVNTARSLYSRLRGAENTDSTNITEGKMHLHKYFFSLQSPEQFRNNFF